MGLGKRRSINTFLIQFLWILLLVFQQSNLVICDDMDEDSLKKALMAIERRQRDLELQDDGYYGQPENIGYGFQKTLGFFDNAGPAVELGSFDSDPKNENQLQNLMSGYRNDEYESGYDKRKSNFRERISSPSKNYLISERESKEEFPFGGEEYLATLRNLWSNYRQSRPDEVNVEDLTDAQVQEILGPLYDKMDDTNEYADPNPESFDVVPVRSRRNYRVFDRFGDRRKRYSRFGEGYYEKRNQHPQNIDYEGPENEFLYSLKYVNPEYNREGIENLREGGEVLGDEKDRDILRILQAAMRRTNYEEEPYWMKKQNEDEDEEGTWMRGPVTLSEDEEPGRNEKKAELIPRHFKNHNGIHLSAKRFPVKRSAQVGKETNGEVTKDLKEIFSTGEPTPIPTKKTTTKKPTEVLKKNVTKPEVTKHASAKKIVRRSNTQEVVYPVSTNEDIAEIFKPTKKSIDWSKYFGIDKRSGEFWLKKDHLMRAEGHLMGRKSKRYPFDRGNVNHLDGSQYGGRLGERSFKKRYPYDIGTNIDKVENKIGDIEEKIIDDAVKYTGAHSGAGKEDIGQVKSKVIKHLEAAYSLEKMKNALEEFKNLINPEETTKKSSTEAPKQEARTSGPKESPNLEKPMPEKKPIAETSKRVSMKKEGVKEIFGVEPSDSLEFLNEGYPTRRYDNEACPVLDKILNNCLRIEEMGGRYAEALVPLCSLQQICYFCGAEIGFSKMSSCDNIYLTEAQNICQGDSGCLVSARNSLLALQDLYEQELGSDSGRRLLSDSCLSNPCVQRYFLASPGAIYPLEVQK